MRRVLVPLTAVGLLGIIIGCGTTRNHADDCDCTAGSPAGHLVPVPLGPESPRIPADTDQKVKDMPPPEDGPKGEKTEPPKQSEE
ncbi:MAG: hypothetical protein L0Z62_06930 [Gemmataceae bacterium]|nr:hypothetical protein [Gemmataceae bacterium]